MAKPIKYPYYLDKRCEVKENYEFSELEDVTVIVGESRFDTHEEDEEWQKENYIRIEFIRLLSDEPDSVDYVDLADSVSGDLLRIVNSIVNPKTVKDYEKRNELIGADDVLGLKNITYLDEVVIYGDVNEKTIAAATAEAFKWATKGFDKTDAVCAAYQNCSFYKMDNGEKVLLEDKFEKAVLKELGFVELPKSMSSMEKSENSILAASVAKLNLTTDWDSDMLLEKKRKIKP